MAAWLGSIMRRMRRTATNPEGVPQPKVLDLWPRGHGYGPRAGEVPDLRQSLALGLGSGALMRASQGGHVPGSYSAP
jgi:hypothetical protein